MFNNIFPVGGRKGKQEMTKKPKNHHDFSGENIKSDEENIFLYTKYILF